MRRVYCVGPAEGEPCPAHGWWLYGGKGRPRERCAVCWAIHEAERRRENHQDFNFKRTLLARASVAQAEREN